MNIKLNFGANAPLLAIPPSSRKCTTSRLSNICKSRSQLRLLKHHRRAHYFALNRATSPGGEDRMELTSSARVLLQELSVLGVPGIQVEQYFQQSKRQPSQEYDNSRSLDCLKLVKSGSNEVADTEALEFVASELRELWMWKRRKGDYYARDGLEMFQIALSDIQDVERKELEKQNSEKISSILLDDLDLSEEDKSKLGDAIRGVAVGGIQTILWNAIVLAVLFLAIINFTQR
mmetsp:Transcript_38475/g.91250  ORF Transcript_38475/g.91250 Transcript_38475/m.91250 type:complete len:233 (+) Transcript_38475:79-777(+)